MKKFVFALVMCVGLNAHAALKIQSWTLDNGARVLFVEANSIPVLDISVEFDAGSRRDPADKVGIASLTNAMLARGVRAADAPQNEPALSEAQISDTLADTAAQRGGGAGNDRAGASLRTLSTAVERDKSVALLARILAHPSFPEELLARDKARTIAAIKEDETKPESIAGKAFWRLLYGSHPYAKHETVESVQSITRDDLVNFHRNHYVANRAVIAMIGNITRADAEAIAKQLTVRLPQGAPLPALPAVPAGQKQEELIAHPASQAHIQIGMPAIERGDPDFFPLTVGNYVLGGGGFVSRLTQEVREKRGLSYSVYSYFSPMAQEGPFQVGLQTQKEQANEALQVVRDTVARFLQEGPTTRELKAAKDNLIGGFPLRIDNNRKILDNMAVIGFYGLPLNYLDTWTEKVAKVTAADIKAAFNRKIAIDRLATVVVGNGKQDAK
ncbi:MAG TPA: pitrilysin family protein [Noviherbaspirillum sp.]|uniref:M16 family metallopeptidase n=1 Tax=Noviherbaspirillum sp. TaxID=1926288 RepID=UPI002DDCA6B2|nr:pitrilysin family protein [Noviherbaspirillum sp.]HEV2609910.1 pitrilysin family protein [Noviherbaspirillum sp.]